MASALSKPGAPPRERFLNTILPRLRQQVLALPKVVKIHRERERPVVVFTARKAVCVADSLERLRYWQPSDDWTSTRALDGELHAFVGSNVLIIEDLVTSGRTIAETVETVRSAGASSISFFALAVEGPQDEWEELLEVPFVGPYLESTIDESVDYAQSLISAFAALPTPYNIDWPTYRLTSKFVRRQYLEMGWEATAAGRRSHGTAATFVAGPALIDAIYSAAPDWFSELLQSTEIAKVRVYPVPRHPHPDATRAIVNPVVSLGELTPDEIEQVGQNVSALLGVEQLGTTARETYRAVQYVLGEMLASVFLRSGGLESEALDQSRLNYLFLGATRDQVARAQVAARAFAIQHLCPEGPLGPRLRAREWPDLIAEQEEAVHCDGTLISIFLERWVNSAEHHLRTSRRKAESRDERKHLTKALVGLDRAMEGGAFAITELLDILETRVGDSVSLSRSGLRARVSEFLDDAIDRGEVVPDVQIRDGIIGRAFRPGEIIDFQRQLAELTGQMLRSFTSTPARRTLSQDRLQKLLAGFFRYLHQQGRLREYSRPQDLPEGAVPLQRRFLIRGIVMDQVDTTEFVGRSGELESARLLIDHKVIKPATKGYDLVKRDFEYADSEVLNATAFGTVLAQMLSLDDRRRRKVDDEAFALLVTLADPLDQVFALSADLELACRVWHRADSQDATALRQSYLHQLVFQGIDKAAWVTERAAESLLDEFLADVAKQGDKLFEASAVSVAATFRPGRPTSEQRRLVQRLGSWFVSAYVYLAALEQLSSDGVLLEQRVIELEARLKRRELQSLMTFLPTNDITREAFDFLAAGLAVMKGGGTIDSSRLKRLAGRVSDVVLDEANPLRGLAYEQHTALMSAPAQRRLVPSCLFLRSRSQGSLKLEGSGLRLAFIDEELQHNPDIAHFDAFFRVVPAFKLPRRAKQLYDSVADIDGEAVLIDNMPTRFQPYLLEDDTTLAFDASFASLLRMIASRDVASRTFLIAHLAKAQSHISNYAREKRIQVTPFEALGARWELSVMGPVLGQTQQQLTLPPSGPPIIHHHHEKGAQYVEQQWNIDNAQGNIGPGGRIDNSTLIQLNEAEQKQARAELNALLEHLGQDGAQDTAEHAEEITTLIHAQEALEQGNHHRFVELLRSGGKFGLDTARELGLELLVRLILPA